MFRADQRHSQAGSGEDKMIMQSLNDIFSEVFTSKLVYLIPTVVGLIYGYLVGLVEWGFLSIYSLLTALIFSLVILCATVVFNIIAFTLIYIWESYHKPGVK